MSQALAARGLAVLAAVGGWPPAPASRRRRRSSPPRLRAAGSPGAWRRDSPKASRSGDPPERDGWGGFKGPPADGIVEIGYEIAEARRGRGLATAATRAMLTEAFADTRVRTVIAHTLAHRNASNRVLQKAGFHHDAQTVQDGAVIWRFSVARPGRA